MDVEAKIAELERKVEEQEKVIKSKNTRIQIIQGMFESAVLHKMDEEKKNGELSKKNDELCKKVTSLEREIARLRETSFPSVSVKTEPGESENTQEEEEMQWPKTTVQTTVVETQPPLQVSDPVPEGSIQVNVPISIEEVGEGARSSEDGVETSDSQVDVGRQAQVDNPQPDLVAASDESMGDSPDDDIVPLENMNQIQDLVDNGRPQRTKRTSTRPSDTGPAHRDAGKKGNKFLCKCQHEFKTKKGLSGHLQMRNNTWKRICRSCGDRFLDKEQLEEHFQSPLNKCTFMSGSTSGGKMNIEKVQREIGRRKKQHGLCPQEDGSNKWKCDCGQEFRSENGFKNHEKRATTPKKFLCPIPACNKTFNYLSLLRIHLKRTHKVLDPLSQFKKGCQKCGKMFETDQEFNFHKRQPDCTVQGQADLVPEAQPLGPLPIPSSAAVTGQVCHPPTAQNVTRSGSSASEGPASVALLRPFSASAPTGLPSLHLYSCACGASFTTVKLLTGHILGNVQGAVFECNGCGDFFLNDQELTQHISTTAACNNVKVKTCGMCKSTFETLKDFNYHKRKCTHYPK